MNDPNVAFTLRVRCLKPEYQPHSIVIIAYDDLGWDTAGRIRLTVEVRHGGRVIFPRGQLHCALHGTSDGITARELVMSLVAMHPSAGGGEGDDYYADYTPDQIKWVEEWGQHLDCERAFRYCDPETGDVRRTG